MYFFKKSVDFSVFQRYNITCLSEKESARECWNWQTGKTKDLVGVCSCGFKSHLPHISKRAESFEFVQVFCSFYCLNDTINVCFNFYSIHTEYFSFEHLFAMWYTTFVQSNRKQDVISDYLMPSDLMKGG